MGYLREYTIKNHMEISPYMVAATTSNLHTSAPHTTQVGSRQVQQPRSRSPAGTTHDLLVTPHSFVNGPQAPLVPGLLTHLGIWNRDQLTTPDASQQSSSNSRLISPSPNREPLWLPHTTLLHLQHQPYLWAFTPTHSLLKRQRHYFKK